MTHFHHMVTFVNYVNVNYVTLFYDITMMNCPLVNFNSLCLPIHWKLVLMCTCTKLIFIQSSFWGNFPRINPLEISDFSKLWMHVLKIINVWNVLYECMSWVDLHLCNTRNKEGKKEDGAGGETSDRIKRNSISKV